MKKIFFTLLVSTLFCVSSIRAQYIPKITTWYQDTITRKKPWQAAATVIGTNLGVWSVDRYAVKADWAVISGSTIKENFRRGFGWDNDKFLTNLFMHPYHGSLYYNAARSNGMSYWQSMPFTMGGSLMWEMFMEKEPPSINDFFSTSFGGMALGEITHRLSTAIVDESAHGIRRIGLEFAGFLLTPTAAITRMINGQMFRTRPKRYYSGYPKYPLYLQVGLGASFNSDEANLFKGRFSNVIDVQLQYNDPFESDECKPFDYFQLSTTVKLFSNQPAISRVNAMAMLWGKNFRPYKNHKMLFGFFQHFDYYDSDSIFKTSTKVPYKISAAASFGGGLLYNFKNELNTIDMNMGIHMNAILMGGSLTDYYHLADRNYNLASGFGSKVYSQIRFSNVGAFYLGLNFYQLYTWQGSKDGDAIPDDEQFKYQGDKGYSNLAIINPRMEFYVTKKLAFNIDIFSHIRNSHYSYLPDVRYHTFEIKSSLVYKH